MAVDAGCILYQASNRRRDYRGVETVICNSLQDYFLTTYADLLGVSTGAHQDGRVSGYGGGVHGRLNGCEMCVGRLATRVCSNRKCTSEHRRCREQKPGSQNPDCLTHCSSPKKQILWFDKTPGKVSS